MRKLLSLMVIVSILLMASIAGAAPFLVCDVPDPAEQVIAYIVYQDGVEIATPTAETDGSLKMDLQAVVPGVYTWTVKAVNVWGVSGDSNPYISPSGVTAPQSTRMEP